MSKQEAIPRPIVKWAGGKTSSVATIVEQIPERFDVYREHFFGGGAVFFALFRAGRIRRAILSDSNDELITTYKAIRYDLDGVFAAIKRLRPSRIDEERYYKIRDSKPKTETARAARMIFMNKVGFNGLYRVNAKGEFNVPWGKYTAWEPDWENLAAASRAFQCADLLTADYRTAASAGKRDVVYFDPPYIPVSQTANFDAYTHKGFPHSEQKALAKLVTKLAARGTTVLASNADVPAARDLYASIPGAKILSLQCARSVNSDGAGRGRVGEILVVANGRVSQ